MMLRQIETTGSEAGYKCASCGRFEPAMDAARMPRQTPCIYDKKTEGEASIASLLKEKE